MAPPYLTELLAPIAASARRHGLQSAVSNDLVVPRVRLVTYGARAFGVAGPACWNGLPNYLKEYDLTFDLLTRQLKTYLFCTYQIPLAVSLLFSALEMFVDALNKCTI